LPILEEFKLTKNPLGQTILGIGVLDDIIEVSVLFVLSVMISSRTNSSDIVLFRHLAIAVFLILSPLILKYIGFIKHSWEYAKTEHLFVGSMMLFFGLVWIGSIIDSPELAAISSGIVIRSYLPENMVKLYESEIKTMAYGLFAPLFFVSVGYETDFNGFGSLLPLIILFVLVTSTVKIMLAYFSTRKKLGDHAAIVTGIALTVRLSTSIIVIKLLYDNNFIDERLLSVLIGTTIIFKFINPPLLATLIKRWKLSK